MKEKNSLIRTILRYSIPSVISMWMFTIYTMVDGIFIGKYVGPLGLAGVNITMPLINFTFAVGIMIAVGSSTMIAIHFGEGDWTAGNKIFTTATLSLAVFGIILSVLITIFIEPVIHFLGGSGVLFPYVKDYMSVVILFCTCYMVGYALEIYIKVDGNPVYPAICVMTGGIINVGLDYLFVVVFPYGIKGAAFATGMSQLTSTSMLLFYILFKTKKIRFVKLKFSFKELLKISKIGFAEFLAEVSTGIAIFVFNIIILRELGEKGVSAFGIIGYISSFVVMTMIGFSQGIQPIVSFNLGAKKYANVIKTLKISLLMIITTGVIFYGSINLFSSKIISTFLNDTETFRMTKYALAAYSFAYIITGLNIVTAGYFTAVKKVKISTIITILRGVVLIIIFLEILPRIFGTAGIWWSVPAAELVTLVSSFYFIRKYMHKYEAIRV